MRICIRIQKLLGTVGKRSVLTIHKVIGRSKINQRHHLRLCQAELSLIPPNQSSSLTPNSTTTSLAQDIRPQQIPQHPPLPSQQPSKPPGVLPTMPLVRPTTGSALVRSAKASKQQSLRTTSATRHISSTPARQAGHAPQYDPPTGWLFGVPPGTKPKKEGWENLMIYGYGGGIVAVCVAYMFKPDTRFVVWRLSGLDGS